MRRFLVALLMGLLAVPVSGQELSDRTKAELRRLFHPGNATDDSVLLGNGTTWDVKAVSNCTDTAGNHLNYTAATNTFSCGTSTSGATGSGTQNNLVKWATTTTLGDAAITDTTSGVTAASFAPTTLTVGGYSNAAPATSNFKGVSTTSGTSNVSGSSVVVGAGVGTGSAAAGTVTLGVAPNAGSGTTLNTLVSALTLGGTAFTLGAVTINSGGTAPTDSTVQGYNAAGTDVAGGALVVAAGRGTGTGSGGSLTLQVAPRNTTGSSLNTLKTVALFRADANQQWSIGGWAANSGASGPANPSGTVAGLVSAGADQAGTFLTLNAGVGTGSGASGSVRVQVDPNSTTSSTAHTLVTAASWSGTSYALGGYVINSGGTAPASSTVFGVNAAGSDVAGGAIRVATGRGTGSAAAPGLTLEVAPNQATGSSLNGLVTAATFNGTSFTVGNVQTVSGGTAPAGSTLAGYKSAGTDVAGGSLTVATGAGTGSAAAAALALQIAPNAATGSSANALKTALNLTGTLFTLGNVAINSGGTAPGASTVQAFNAAGTDIAGGSLSVNGGTGTGTGDGGAVTIKVAPDLATGTTAGTLQTVANFTQTLVAIGGITTISGGTAPGASTFSAYHAAGTDIAGGGLTIGSGKGTGTGAASTLVLQTPNVTTAGTGAQSLATRMTFDTTGAIIPSGEWLRQVASRAKLASNFTNATATMSNTALSVTVDASRHYTFYMTLFLADSVAADGVKIDFDGGAATATDVRIHCTLYDTALLLSAQTSAIATDFTQATVTGDAKLECAGSFEPSAAGTFIVRAAQVSHTVGTLTVYRGSWMWIEDVTGT